MSFSVRICAGLSPDRSVIRGVSESEDMKATLDCMAAMGAEWFKNADTVTVTGADIRSARPQSALECRESGSTMRFFIPIALACGAPVELRGSRTLLSRPMDIYMDMCAERGLTFLKTEDSVMVKGPLKPGRFYIPGNVSSQFITGLLFALPLLEGDSCIDIIPPVESRSYIDLTLQALEKFKIEVRTIDNNSFRIPGGQTYKGQDVTIEGDYSNSAFFLALNALGGNVTVTGLAPGSLQGDRICGRHLESLCAGAAEINISDIPDLGPVLMAVAAAKHGAVLTGTKRLRIKESDRAQAMAEELRKFGAKVEVYEDAVKIDPAPLHAPQTPLNGHNDHRVVMSLAVLLTLTGGVIAGAEAVRKSFPDFFEKLNRLGIRTEKNDYI